MTATTRHALFNDHASAQRAIATLRDNGVHDDHISVLGRHDGDIVEEDMDGNVAEAATDIVSKAALGSGVGALLGVAALAIPGVGPFVAAGAIAQAAAGGAAVTGAALGAAAGGLAGVLNDHGIDKHDAEFYEQNLTGERTMVAYDSANAAHPDVVSGDVLYSSGGYSRTRPLGT